MPARADDAPKLPNEFLGLWISDALSDFGRGVKITPGGHIEWIENPEFRQNGSPDDPKVFEQDTYQVIGISDHKDKAYLLVKHGNIPREPYWDPRMPYWYVELALGDRLWMLHIYKCGATEDAWNNIQHLRDSFRTDGPCQSREVDREPFSRLF